MRNLQTGDLVKLKKSRKRWWLEYSETGVVLSQSYMAYDTSHSKWRILIGDDVREVAGFDLSFVNSLC